MPRSRKPQPQPPDSSPLFNTTFLLLARYGGLPVVPVEDVCRDFFRHMTPENFVRKVSAGDIALPLVRMDGSQKCAKGVGLADLAAYLDRRIEAARKECEQLCGPPARGR